MYLGKFLGIEVSLHWSWFIALAYFSFNQVFGPPAISFTIFIGIFAIILIHEFGHILVSKKLGFNGDKIYIHLLGGVAWVGEEKDKKKYWWKDFLVIFAGPFTNIILIPILYLVGLFLGMTNFSMNPIYENHTVIEYVFYQLFILNIFILIFNMLPVMPLDGGQIAHSLLWGFLNIFKLKRSRNISGIIVSSFGLITSLVSFILIVRYASVITSILFIFIAIASFAHLDNHIVEYKNYGKTKKTY